MEKTIFTLKKNIISCVNYRTIDVKQPDVASGGQPETKPLHCALMTDLGWLFFFAFLTLSILSLKFQLPLDSFLLRLLILKWHFNLDWLTGVN